MVPKVFEPLKFYYNEFVKSVGSNGYRENQAGQFYKKWL